MTHLHGARIASDSDGWTENVSTFRHAQRTTFHDRPRSATLWYHDHALGVTRLNVYAGLFGVWLIRDDVEAGLIKDGTLPGGKDEVALVIQDRNLDTDDKQALDGRILHKSETSTAEMFAPYTMVNGVIWPKMDVGAGPVRFRLLNGSNARTFCLRLVRVQFSSGPGNDGGVIYTDDLTQDGSVPMWQVGTDGGLLDFPVKPTSMIAVPPPPPAPGSVVTVPPAIPPVLPVVDRGLILAPAERVDLVIDFSTLKLGDAVALVNTAYAPFHGSTVTFPFAFQPNGTLQLDTGETAAANAGQTDLGQRVTHAHVLLFNVNPTGPKLPGGDKPSPLTTTTPLDKNFQRYVHNAGDGNGRNELLIPDDHTHRWIALSEFPPGKLYFRELEEVTPQFGTVSAFPGGPPIISITEEDGTQKWFRTAAMAFHDAVRIEAKFGHWEVWNLVNLTVDTHPIHVHLVEFQVLDRIPVDTSVYVAETGATPPGQPIDETKSSSLPPRLLDPNEQGYKDTVRVNPGEVVKIAMLFDGFCGRYMYHCHILEHEDMDMMRPFVVVTPQALAAMQANGMNGGGMGGMPM